ncbi:MAG TPA: hypothetical protein VJP45_11340 [Candidatus Limnocylindria bacterium]|nr:hypothetical protein [Candidatus Limnocylindria bacterium]
MSYTLLVWGSPVPDSAREAGELIKRPSDTTFDATPALVAFVRELLDEFPTIAADPKRSPWSVMPTPSERFVELDFSSRAKDADIERVVALARRHGLVVYDPEGPALYPPPEG